ncbi:right-handed parallel beta-helix repeat-containing protein [Salinibacterium sp. SYSU T00001]|uniref:right-handed parallel beta-helix repeat-containing protein n=1 Tax=Homoserinimonas sedimenticola TaxID=2986805 RepID=UPI0022365E11|nr:right-handed parallel beta-helix repeat-containing protein [Salinibacterium sedimenticola]MCW4384445.1 right-handed parallel beta-helix repeat-containing protein [Salinibacterium sedimenticola]
MAAALSLGAVAAPANAATVATSPAAQELTVSPAGSGNQCTTAAPCTLASALTVATPGAAITALPGEYGAQILRGMRGGTAEQPITVTASDGATFQRLETHVPHVTWVAPHITVVLYVHPTAVGTVVERAHLEGAGSFVRSTDVVIRDSLFENGTAIDGIQIKDSRRVTFSGNTVRNYSLIPGNNVHVDCVQVFDSHDVTIERNSLRDCSNSAIILSNGNGYGSSNIHILSNFIQGCTVVTTVCVGGSSIDTREPVFVGTVIRNNTIATGPARIGATPGLIFDRNIVEYFFGCDAPMTNTIVVASRYASCLPQLGVDGNRSGSVTFVDAASGDLRLMSAGDAQLSPIDSGMAIDSRMALIDIDGQPVKDSIAGAHSPITIALSVSVKGTGTACTSLEPCSLSTALGQAEPGSALELASGDYGRVSVSGAGGSAAEPIVVQPANGAVVRFAKLTTAIPHVHWHSLSFTAGVATSAGATGTILDGVSLSGAGAYILASDVVIRDSAFTGGSGDGIHVRSADRVTIENTSVTGFGGDCVQIIGGTGHSIRDNALQDCAAAAVIVGGNADNVLVAGNIVAGKVGVALDVRDATGVTVRDNQLLSGSTRFGDGAAVDANTIAYLGECDAKLSNSVVLAWNAGLCALPLALGRLGNSTPQVLVAREEGTTAAPVDAPEVAEVTEFPEVTEITEPLEAAAAIEGQDATTTSDPAVEVAPVDETGTAAEATTGVEIDGANLDVAEEE